MPLLLLFVVLGVVEYRWRGIQTSKWLNSCTRSHNACSYRKNYSSSAVLNGGRLLQWRSTSRLHSGINLAIVCSLCWLILMAVGVKSN